MAKVYACIRKETLKDCVKWLQNSPIDSWSMQVLSLGKKSFLIENGARIAQMVLCPIVKANLKEVKTLEDTKRGSGGFGSTGTK